MGSPDNHLLQHNAASVPKSANQRHSALSRMILMCVLLFVVFVVLHVFLEQLYLTAMPPPPSVAPPAPVSEKRPPKSPPTVAAAHRPDAAPRPSTYTLAERRAKVNRKEIWMDGVEVDLVLRHLGGVRNYLEWGSGGSTVNFAQFATRRAVSIEHNPQWCQLMTRRIKRAHIRPVDLRCVRNSAPFKTDGHYREFRAYVDEIAKLGEPLWDFVLVDGRCRVGAAIRALSYVSDKSVLVLHDSQRMSQNGAPYRKILDYYDVIESVAGSNKRGLAVLKRKKALSALQGDHEKVQMILNNVFGMKK